MKPNKRNRIYTHSEITNNVDVILVTKTATVAVLAETKFVIQDASWSFELFISSLEHYQALADDVFARSAGKKINGF